MSKKKLFLLGSVLSFLVSIPSYSYEYQDPSKECKFEHERYYSTSWKDSNEDYYRRALRDCLDRVYAENTLRKRQEEESIRKSTETLFKNGGKNTPNGENTNNSSSSESDRKEKPVKEHSY